jgi:hypothetical protein
MLDMLDRMLAAFESHYAENILVAIFWSSVALLILGSAIHDAEMAKWAERIAENDLSALFGMLVGKRNQPQPQG